MSVQDELAERSEAARSQVGMDVGGPAVSSGGRIVGVVPTVGTVPTTLGTVEVGAGGIGSGAITIWIWNQILVPRTGLPEIPAEIAALVAPLLVALGVWLWRWMPVPPGVGS